MSVNFFCLVGCSGFTCTDSPNRFISQNDLSEVFSRQVEQRALDLSIYHFEMLAGFSFFQHFTDTEDRSQTVGQSQFNLCFQDFRSFVIVSTSFGVAQDHIFCTCRSNHSSRNFASVSAFLLVCAVFSSNTDLVRVDSSSNACQVSERSTDDHITVRSFTFKSFIQAFCQSKTFRKGSVHLPVSCNNILSHDLIN